MGRGIAARVAEWQKRFSGIPAPLAPAGADPSYPAIVELFINEQWIDISGDVRYESGITITRGRRDEGADLEPSQCTLTLNNRDGVYSPRNPNSPYYGQFGRNTPLRVCKLQNGIRRYRFYGEVSEWPVKWDISGTDVWVELVASGITRRLSQGASPLRSTLYRELTKETRTGIVGYWPFEEQAGATQVASGLDGVGPLRITGTPTFGSYTDYTASDALPVMGSGVFSGVIPNYAVDNQEISVRFFIAVPSGGVASTQGLCSINTRDGVKEYRLELNAAGAVQVVVYDVNGSTLSSSGFALALNGLQSQLLFEIYQSGADILYRVTHYNLADATIDNIPGTQYSGTAAAGHTIGKVTGVKIANEGGLTDVTIGHFTVANDLGAYASTGAAMLAWRGETVTNRLTRLMAEEGINYVERSFGQTGNFTSMGDQEVKTFIDLINECATTDMSILHEDREQIGYVRRTRLSLYNQSAYMSLSHANHELTDVPTPVDDDQATINDITVQRNHGSFHRSILSDGALSVQAPPNGVGRYATSLSISLGSDDQVANQADWRLHLGTIDEARYPGVAIQLAHSTFTGNLDLTNSALTIDIGDRLDLVDLPSWLPPDDVSTLVQGYTETLDQYLHQITFNCTPESGYRVAVTDDTTLGHADTEGSELASDVLAGATSISVSTTSGPIWTTDSNDMPFDIRVGPETMTVTAISGSSSPQTFTVTRGVNTVDIAHSAGTDVKLRYPAIVPLS